MRWMILALCATLGFSQASVKDCGVGAVFAVNSIQISPSIPAPGDSATLLTSYTVPETVNGGTAYYSCVLNGMPIWSEHYDLCLQTMCPITVGQHDEKSISEIPKVSGKLVCNIEWKDIADRQLMCIQMTLKLGAGTLRGFGRPTNSIVTVPSKALIELPQPYEVDLPYATVDSTTTGVHPIDSMWPTAPEGIEKIDNATCPVRGV